MAFAKDITLGQYLPLDSAVHHLDPRSKILLLFFLMIVLVAFLDPAVYGIVAVLLVAGIAAAGVPYRAVFGNMRPFFWLFLLTFLLNLIHRSGAVLWTIPGIGLAVTEGGLLRAGLFTARIVLMIGFAAVFTLTTAPIDIADGLSRLFGPLRRIRVPVDEFAMMVTIGIRFIPTLLDEAERIRSAQKARGAVFSGSPVQRLRSLSPLVIPLFIAVFRKADEVALAMVARYYRPGIRRSSYNQLVFGISDYAALGLGVLLLALAILAR